MRSALLLILTFLSTISFADSLTPEVYLYKISRRLTGQWPTPIEYSYLHAEMNAKSCREVSCLTDFYRDYIRKKLETPEFYSEAVLKTFDKFGFQTVFAPPFPMNTGSINYDFPESSDQLLIYRVFHDNLSVDELFRSQEVWKVQSENNDPFGSTSIHSAKPVSALTVDLKVYSDISGVVIQSTNYSGHPNVSGLFSGVRFLMRYWNNPINNGRKRAAAVFKTMICDALFPALDRGTQLQREESISMGEHEKITSQSAEAILKNRHANQKDCAVCHVRLDPLAHSMRPLEIGVGDYSTGGFFRYYTAPGVLKSIKVANFHQLVEAAIQQPKYSECQLNWLFNWIIGHDVQIHPLRYMQLLSKFDSSGRKVKTIIEELLLSPEFQGQTVKFAEPESFVKARAVFEGKDDHCVHCHGSFLRSGEADLKQLLGKIAFKLDLPHDGAKRIMPPATHWWAPNADDIKAVKTWIQEGAPLGDGHTVLTPAEVKVLLPTKPGRAK